MPPGGEAVQLVHFLYHAENITITNKPIKNQHEAKQREQTFLSQLHTSIQRDYGRWSLKARLVAQKQHQAENGPKNKGKKSWVK